MKILKNLTFEGRRVVAKIHQSSYDILRLFDDIILLNHRKIVFQGEVNNLINYFDNIIYKYPEYTNPSYFIVMNILNPLDLQNNNDDITINYLKKKKINLF